MSVDNYFSGPAFSALMVPGAAEPIAFTGPLGRPYQAGPATAVSFGPHTAMTHGEHKMITRFGVHVPVFGLGARVNIFA